VGFDNGYNSHGAAFSLEDEECMEAHSILDKDNYEAPYASWSREDLIARICELENELEAFNEERDINHE